MMTRPEHDLTTMVSERAMNRSIVVGLVKGSVLTGLSFIVLLAAAALVAETNPALPAEFQPSCAPIDTATIPTNMGLAVMLGSQKENRWFVWMDSNGGWSLVAIIKAENGEKVCEMDRGERVSLSEHVHELATQ